MSEVWNQWQGYVVDGTFPLHRYLGGSDRSAVFLSELRGREPAEVAIKLVPTLASFPQSHLARWEATASLSHPHLLRILGTGRGQLGGQFFQFAVMEYSDENLAGLLERRAMTEDEAREMLPPVLSALAFLHNRNLVQGQLKPANVLVVGDQIKLASDTVRSVSDAAAVNMASAFDPPESQDGVCSTAGDIWALGVTLFEALTRKSALGLELRPDTVVLPADFPVAFRDIVTGCLSRRPYDRPKVAELEAKLRGQPAGGAVRPAGGPPEVAQPVVSDIGQHDNGGKRGSIEISQWEAPSPPGRTAPEMAPSRGETIASQVEIVPPRGPTIPPQGAATDPVQPAVVEHVFREVPSPGRGESRPAAVQSSPTSVRSPPPAPKAVAKVGVPGAAPADASSVRAAAPPAAVRPAVMQSGVARPAVPQPGVSQSSVVRPNIAPPSVSQSAVTRSGVARPAVMRPGVSQSDVVQPAVAPRDVTRSPVARSVRAPPGVAQPAVVLPDVGRGAAARPSSAQLGVAQDAAGRSPNAYVGGTQPVAARPAAAQVDVVQHPVGRSAVTQPGVVQPAIVLPDIAQPDRAQRVAARPANAQPGGSQRAAARLPNAQPDETPRAAERPASGQVDAAQPTVERPGLAQPAVVRSAAQAGVAQTWVGRFATAEADVALAAVGQSADGPVAAVTDDGPGSLSEETPAEQPLGLRLYRLPVALGIVAIAILVWAGMRAYNAYQAPIPAITPVAEESDSLISSAVASVVREPLPARSQSSVFTTSKVKLGGDPNLPAARQPPAAEPTPPESDIHEEFPDVPQHVRRSIRGHVKVTVRVIIDKDGSVFAALVDQPGPSRYFERLAIEAAKKWTFPAADTQISRLELVRFDFTHDGTTAQADVVE